MLLGLLLLPAGSRGRTGAIPLRRERIRWQQVHARCTVWDESCNASRSSDGHTRTATNVFEEALGYSPGEFFRGAEQLVDDAMRALRGGPQRA